jgi:hypothetical protein
LHHHGGWTKHKQILQHLGEVKLTCSRIPVLSRSRYARPTLGLNFGPLGRTHFLAFFIVFMYLKYFFPVPLFLFFNTQTVPIKSMIPNTISVHVVLKTLHPGGIRTRIFCSRGGCDVQQTTHARAGRTNLILFKKHRVNFHAIFYSFLLKKVKPNRLRDLVLPHS